MSRIRITMDNAALRDVATRAAATREPEFDGRAAQVVRRVAASHGGRPVEEVYEALWAALVQLPGVQRFDEAQIRGCATRIGERRDPLPRT